MLCLDCENTVPAHLRECPSCGTDCGFPNVRLVNMELEVEALNKRVSDAFTSAKARNCDDVLEAFGEAVKSSKAVIARDVSEVHRIVSDDKNSYASFQKQVQSRARSPHENEFDRVRLQYEGALYPFFSEDIIFGSLSLSGKGMSGYGGVTMVLKDRYIAKRASIFEENPHTFVEKHRVVMNKSLPMGYRADWPRRHLVAIAKLHNKMAKDLKKEDFATILENDTGDTGTSDFVEVHIYGTVNRNVIEQIISARPSGKMDRVTLESVVEQLEQIGATAIIT